MKNIGRYIWKILENLVIQIIILLIASGTLYVFRDKFFYSMSQPIPIWIASLSLICVSIAVYIIPRMRRGGFPAATVRYRTGDEDEIPFTLYDVNWIAYIPNPNLSMRDEYVWVTGPLCPNCNLELTWKKGLLGTSYYWLCERCNKRFARPRKKEYDMIRHVENICYSDIFLKSRFKKDGGGQ